MTLERLDFTGLYQIAVVNMALQNRTERIKVNRGLILE